LISQARKALRLPRTSSATGPDSLTLEGGLPGSAATNVGNGLEIYRNDGGLHFTRVTPGLLPVNSWHFSDFQYREFGTADVDGDGYQDVVLQAWNGGLYRQGSQLNLGIAILLNQAGTGFASLDGTSGTRIAIAAGQTAPKFLRVMDRSHGQVRLFGLTGNGTPVVFTVRRQ